MFQKNTFGASTSFGGFSAGAATSSPFGGFKPAGSSGAFGAAPAFGASATPQPAAGGGLFGSPSTSSGLFGASSSTAAAAPAFGSAGGGFGFGQPAAGGGLFGAAAGTSGGGLFGQAQPAGSAFGAKPAGFGFNNASTSGTAGGGLFGANTSGGGLFGQQNTSLGGGGGLFSSTAGGFGQQQQATGTALVKFSPVLGTDSLVKSGQTTSITIKHHCITCMKEYENKSLEELRLEDYTAGRRGNAAAAFQPPAETKPAGGLFGQSAFGQPAASTGGMFGATPAFPQTNSAFSFGGAAQPSTSTSLFGAAKPAFGATSTAGGGLFGATSAAPAPAFGASTGSFGFGAAASQPQSTGMFGAKPAGAFGAAAAPAASGFGAFGSGATGGGLFGAKPASTAPAFGTAAPAFGTATAGAFGTATSAAGGLFGGAGLGAKPAAPAFGFGAPQPNQTLGGAGLGTLGGGAFNQPKPAFPSFSAGSSFALPAQQPAPSLSLFGTSALGGGGLGGGLGGGALGGSALAPGVGASANSSSVHEQILSLAARPYGDSPLFRDLPSTGATSEDILRPTNPAAVRAVLDKSNYRVSPPDTERLKVRPLGAAPSRNKKSLFDGLEEADASLEERLSLKPSRKRLVLRPQQNHDDTAPGSAPAESPRAEGRGGEAGGARGATSPADVRGVNTDLEEDTDRRSSWLGSRISPSSPRARPAAPDAAGSPRIYPDLDKETSDRRSSWLTTKPLRKAAGGGGGTAAAESSVRELRPNPGLYPDLSPLHDKENISTVCDGSIHGFCGHRAGSAARSRCEKISHQIRGIYVSEEESISSASEGAAHPAGVKLSRPGYYTVPSLQEMIAYIRPDGSCPLPQLVIGRRNYGSIAYDTEIDVAGLDLDRLVHFMNKEVMVYPEESGKPPVGTGLNRRAVVTLDRVWPRDKTTKQLIVDPDRLLKMDYEAKLRRVCDKHDTKFVEYRPQTGSWVFRVEHFSKYGLTDSDEEEEAPDIIRRQLRPAPAPAAAVAPVAAPVAAVARQPLGLGGASPPAASSCSVPASPAPPPPPPPALRRTDGLAMDTSEESEESQSMYPDTSSVYGVKSPTTELSRLDLHSSHRVQLMKASLYSDTLLHDADDDVSVSTGDQLVPQPGSPAPRAAGDDAPPSELGGDASRDTLLLAREMVLRPLVVKPHTLVLRYHRRVPPFARTVAGRLDAACVADMAVCRARHCRAGFAPGGRLALVTTHERLASLAPSAELSELGAYTAGRGADDWSPAAVARVAVAGRAAAADPQRFQEAMEPHLLALLEHSVASEDAAGGCPRLAVRADPASRLALLRAHRSRSAERRPEPTYGVSSTYWREVWALCEALWAGELEEAAAAEAGAAAAGGAARALARQRALAAWLRDAVAAATDAELARPVVAEPDSDGDTHSQRVLTLMLGGRLLEACRVARDHKDLNMAVLISQASGDAAVRQLLERQLIVWRECGALRLVSRPRLLALLLAAGRRELDGAGDRLDVCAGLDWLRAFAVHASYLCRPVASVEEAVRSYEGMFRARGEGAAGEAAGGAADDGDEDAPRRHRPGLERPLPPYCGRDALDDTTPEETSRRPLDLRYELLRAHARGTRPDVQPHTHTPDPLDYSLSFLLGTWLGGASVAAVSGAAEQLEAAGAWHLAVLALMYHAQPAVRGALVRGVIARNAPARADTAEAAARLAFLRRLALPERWVALAQAHRAGYERLWSVQAERLARAGEWNAAHRVLLERLAPDAVLAEEPERLAPLLAQLEAAAAEERVAGWAAGGRALLLYLQVCDEIRSLVSQEGESAAGASPALRARLEALRPRVALACRALGALPAPDARRAAARAQLGARLLQAAACAGASSHELAAALRALRLPPDCRAPLLHKITTELAEQASESCAASAASSPISSHARSLAPATTD